MGEAVRSFAVLTYMLPGMPLIYSGQEAGFDHRLAFFEKDLIDWTDPDDFSSFYSALNRFKKEQKALQAPGRSGVMSEIGNDRPKSVWSFRRTKEGSEVIALLNLSDKTVEVTFEEPLPDEGYRLFPSGEEATAAATMQLQPWEYRIYYK